MSKKKIGLIILLVIIVAIVVVVIASSTTKKEKNNNIANTAIESNRTTGEVNNNGGYTLKEVTVSKLSDGTLYTTIDEEIKADIVVGDNLFDTQMADLNLNFSKYKGKTIEIEGMYLENGPYTFVGRYSTSNICPDCPTGYTYFEYEFKGNDLPELKDEQDWIKVVGTLKSDYDEDFGSEYYYIDVSSLEVMNERGLETVSN